MNATILTGDVLDKLRTLPDNSVQCVVTSPPYYGLRDYGVPGQIGLEPTPAAYVARMVEVFREVRRVLREDGVCWLNLGDSYNGSGGAGGDYNAGGLKDGQPRYPGRNIDTLKPKDLIGIPWRVAFALQEDGWWLRSDIIWAKPNPMPESVTDRPTKSHEYIFLLTKSARYFYDSDAIREEPQSRPKAATEGYHSDQRRQDDMEKYGMSRGGNGLYGSVATTHPNGRNARSVWTIATQPFSGAKLVCDYVGADGKPYTASPDCPIHGHLANRQSPQTGGGDERQDSPESRNLDSDSRHVPTHAGAHDAISLTPSGMTCAESSQLQTSESTPANKRHDQTTDEPDLTDDGETSYRTVHSESQTTLQDDMSDSPLLDNAQTAKPSNTQIRRTGHVPETNPAYTLFDETSYRIDGTQAQRGNNGHDARTHANSSAAGCAPGASGSDPSEQTTNRNADKLVFPYANGNTAKCVCQITTIDHFATFPEELPRRCILAGTSAHGCCPECGAPWERVVERTPMVIDRSNNHPPELRTRTSGTMLEPASATTTGWRATCAHDAAPIPCTVLDPFAGSGTTLAVSLALGRNAIGIELNPEYVKLAQRRLAGVTPALFGV